MPLLEADENHEPSWRAPARGWDVVSIADAYDELTSRAFGIWVRLHLCNSHQFKLGRGRLSEKFKVSKATFDRVLRELIDLGYITIESRSHKNRTTIQLVKRARTGGSNLFTKV